MRYFQKFWINSGSLYLQCSFQSFCFVRFNKYFISGLFSSLYVIILKSSYLIVLLALELNKLNKNNFKTNHKSLPKKRTTNVTHVKLATQLFILRINIILNLHDFFVLLTLLLHKILYKHFLGNRTSLWLMQRSQARAANKLGDTIDLNNTVRVTAFRLCI